MANIDLHISTLHGIIAKSWEAGSLRCTIRYVEESPDRCYVKDGAQAPAGNSQCLIFFPTHRDRNGFRIDGT